MANELAAGTAEGGNYEVIRSRLVALGERLQQAGEALNTRRAATFGSTGLQMLGHERIRTENNCIPADIVQVGGVLLLGYNVFLGLKRQITVADVFSLSTFAHSTAVGEFHAVTDEARLAFLKDRAFLREFDELYQYYKDARLIQLRVVDSKLLAVFQTGATARDVKVLRWAVDPGGRVTYLDNRGERDHSFPPSHDFEWTKTTRADHVEGRHPHVNILDTVFVETVGGDLTVKVENNTQDGRGIYAEPVEDGAQSLDDADIQYSKRGSLVLLKIKPFRETSYRYLVFDATTQAVVRVDAIGTSCTTLPEDHGIVFPGGYYLRTGEFKLFDAEKDEMELVRGIASPNGEDVLYVFFRRRDGLYALYPYNLIRKDVQAPIHAHGWSLFDDGTMIVFKATEEPVRVHPAQIWATPFVSPEHHQTRPSDGSLLGRIGNKDLVRGISDLFTLVRLIRSQQPTRAGYEALVASCTRYCDAYYWASEADVGGLRGIVDEVRRTAELVIDEFLKVQAQERRAAEILAETRAAHDRVLADVRPEYFERIDAFLSAMTRLRAHRGHLITLREVRYIERAALDAMEAEVVARFDLVGQRVVAFLLGDGAFAPLRADLDALLARIEAVAKAHELAPFAEQLDGVNDGIAVLGEVVSGLEVEDPTVKTGILEGIGEIVAHGNRVRAILDGRRRSLRSNEGRAEFGAQFKLFAQSVGAALAVSSTPELCDEQLSRRMLQLEELEARFGDLDEFLPRLTEKREEVVLAFEARKQGLLEERQRRVSSLVTAAERILEGIVRRSRTFGGEDELAAWFAADPMVDKLRRITEQLLALGDTVRGDELQARLKSARQDALRGLRDKLDLFDGGDLVRLGKHRFTVNTRPLELTLVPHGDGLALHLTGTDYLEPLDDPALAGTRRYWDQPLISENADVYRGETLAYAMLVAAEERGDIAVLETTDDLLPAVRTFAADRYDEGYERGIHDVDAARILAVLLQLRRSADLLAFPSSARALAALYWAFCPDKPADVWIARARSLVRLRTALGPSPELGRLAATFADAIRAWHPDGEGADLAGRYLVEVLARDPVRFPFARAAAEVEQGLLQWLDGNGGPLELGERWDEQFTLTRAWLETFAAGPQVEAAALMTVRGVVAVDASGTSGVAEIEGLLGQHPKIHDGKLELRLDELLARLERFCRVDVPAFRAFRRLRSELVERERRRLRIDELVPRVMTSFVRNQLVDQVYLPLVGDNLAKQLGAAGEGRRTDLMGLLLLASPPGYGKTTLMEYVASRLGLTFVKVNGPALGHDVRSLDPDEAPNATARQEVEKIGLALEMGNNVMLYLDDIQHCDPELLQKFISLCDGQRKIEGVWRGRTRTYDLRGKKFCVVMAGNPYTEAGAKFRIPDMLANRADTYNLGDVLHGRDEQFAMSFLENAVTSNPALAPIAARPADLVDLVRAAREGEPGGADVLPVLRHLMRCREVLLKVNAEYIRSAAMEDHYRTEPRFQLQGSYRNMNKLAEKVVAVMNDAEIEALITDHYRSESQTLTTGAESNLLKLAELRGTATEAETARWTEIRDEFRRRQMLGGDDPATRISGVLTGVSKEIGLLAKRLDAGPAAIAAAISSLGDHRELAAAMVGITETLSEDRTGPVVDVLTGIDRTLSSPSGLGEVLAELRAIREALARQPAPAPSRPNGDPLRAARQLLLSHAQATLTDDPRGAVEANGNTTLAAALSVIEVLTVQMATAARAHLPPDDHLAFVDDLKRSVASAVTNLASALERP